MKFMVMSTEDAPRVPGRRDWVEYRDYGVEDASGGLLSTHRLTVHPSEQRVDVKTTGWHYHDCDFQWTYLIEGWVDLELEDGTTARHEAGQVFFLPGGYGHNETAASETVDLIEIFMPPSPRTVSIDVPEAWRDRG
jgi:hypothetical protein